MSSQRERDRDEYYRLCYSLKVGEIFPAEPWERSQAHLHATQLKLARMPGRLTKFNPLSDAAQRDYLRQHYGDGPPRGLGVRQGEYVTVNANEVNEERRMIATDFLLDCHALVLVARDSAGRLQQTLLAHMDSMTDVPNTIPELLARMPAGSKVEATIIGSKDGYNPYLHGAMLEAMAHDKRVSRIRENIDLANTVAVDTSTGRILVATAPGESLATAGDIMPSEIPIVVQFSSLENNSGLDTRRLVYEAFRNGRPTPVMGLVDAWNRTEGLKGFDGATRYINSLVESDGGLSAEELQTITARLSATLRQQIRLEIGQPAPNEQRSPITVHGTDGAKLGTFVSNILPDMTVAQAQAVQQ